MTTSSMVTVRYWAGARRAAGRNSEEVHATTLTELLDALSTRPGMSAVLGASSVLVDGTAGRPDQSLPPGAVVDILPPFAGG